MLRYRRTRLDHSFASNSVGGLGRLFLATTPFLLSLPLLLHYRDIFGGNFWSRPIWSTAVETYKGYYLVDGLKPTLVLIFLFGIMVGDSLLRMLGKSRERSPECGFSPPEIILVGGFLFYPALLAVLTKLLDSGYTSRYGWPAILGLLLGSVYLFRTIWLKSYATHLLGALLIVFALQSGLDFTRLSMAGSSGPDGRWSRLAELSRDETDKENSDDARESLSYKLKKILEIEAEKALCTDPYVKDPALLPLSEVLDRSEILILGVPHGLYKTAALDLSLKTIVDVWNFFGKGGQF